MLAADTPDLLGDRTQQTGEGMGKDVLVRVLEAVGFVSDHAHPERKRRSRREFGIDCTRGRAFAAPVAVIGRFCAHVLPLANIGRDFSPNW